MCSKCVFLVLNATMGKIKDFFKKVGGAFRKAGRWIKNKALPVVGRIVKPILNVVGMLPGKIGMIGKVGSAIAGAATGIINKIPNQQAREKLQGVVNNVNNKVQEGVNKGQQIATVANNVIDATKQGIGNVSNVIKPAILKPAIPAPKVSMPM